MVQGRESASVLRIEPAAAIHGTLSPPGDKSISHRYLMLGAIARGTTQITNLAPGADARATANCMRALGADIDEIGVNAVRVTGRGWELTEPRETLDTLNSGTTMRLLAGLLAGRPMSATLTGDASLRRRPMQRVIDPLTTMGARIEAEDGRAPLTIHGGGLRGISWRPPVASAQIKSAVMLAALSASGESEVIEAQATRDHSELAFPAFGLRCSVDGRTVRIPGGQEAMAHADEALAVPGDPSSAAVWCAAAAAIPGSSVRIERVCLNPRRLGFVDALRNLGAEVTMDVTHRAGGEDVGTIVVSHGGHGACDIGGDQVPDVIDELPVIAARAALGGSLDVRDATELRVKESDRITALVKGFRALGVDADERPDGFVVRGGRPEGGTADAAGDHRLVMAFAIVGLGSRRGVSITGADAVTVSYPGFAADLARLRQ